MHKKHFLVCYDIRDTKRLQRLQRLVSKELLQVQYSLYYGTLYPHQMDNLIAKISKIINIHHDDVRIYETQSLESAFIKGKRVDTVMLFGADGERISL